MLFVSLFILGLYFVILSYIKDEHVSKKRCSLYIKNCFIIYIFIDRYRTGAPYDGSI